MEESKSPNKTIIALVVIVLLVAAAGVTVALGSSKSPTVSNTSTTPTVATSATPSTSVSPNATFKDGAYTASTNYDTPGGTQTMTVKMTISGGAVTDSTVSETATSREDEQYQQAFEEEYKSDVVGKKLSDINLDRISGASLTTVGFNSALADIERQAQA